MKIRTVKIILLLTVFSLLMPTSCGTISRIDPSQKPAVVAAATVDDYVEYWLDDHKTSKKTADKAFDNYASKAFPGLVKTKTLVSIKHEKDLVSLTYYYRFADGEIQGIVLRTSNFKTGYRKKHRQYDKAFVNGKQYEFRH